MTMMKRSGSHLVTVTALLNLDSTRWESGGHFAKEESAVYQAQKHMA